MNETATCRFSPGDFVRIPNGRNDGAYEVIAVLQRVNKAFEVNFLVELAHAATGHVLLHPLREELVQPLHPRKAS